MVEREGGLTSFHRVKLGDWKGSGGLSIGGR